MQTFRFFNLVFQSSVWILHIFIADINITADGKPHVHSVLITDF